MIKPYADRVVIKRIEEATTTPGGLHIPDNAKEKPLRGTVIATGPGKVSDYGERISMCASVGDVVIFGKYAGTEVEIDGENYLILRDEEIIGCTESSDLL